MENKPNSIKTFATGHPFFFALAFFAVSFCLDIGISLVGRTLLPMAYVAAIDKAVQFLLALGMLAWLDWLQAAGFNGPSRWRSLHLLWLPALLALLYLASLSVTPLSSPAVVVFAAISVLLTGLHEETRFRGLILQALLPYGPLGGAALSALFFGLFHLVNLLALGPSVTVFAQVIGGALLGFGFAACRLRTNTIWPLIIFHALYDLPADITLLNARSVVVGISMLSPVTVVIALVVPGFILACYGLFLLRPGRQSAKQLETM